MFTYIHRSSALHSLNPAMKLLGLAVVAAAATTAFDPFIPGMLLLALWLTAWLFGQIPFKQMLRWSVPIAVLPLPIAAFNALFADLSRYSNPHIIWHWGIWTLSREGLMAGLGLGLRVAVFVAVSLVFIATTDPTDFALSLVQNLKVPYRFGYGILISYRFLPLMRRELALIRMAHQVRGVGGEGGLRGMFAKVRRYAIPLLASAIRKSERTALAMEAKAFGALKHRTYYRQMRIHARDFAFVAVLVVYTVAVYAVALHFHLASIQWVPGT